MNDKQVLDAILSIVLLIFLIITIVRIKNTFKSINDKIDKL